MAGQPVRFILGHVVRLRIRNRLTPDLWTVEDRGYLTPCWIFRLKPSVKDSYCRVSIQGTLRLAHRVAYEQFVGPIPDGLIIDHLCRNPSCVNPEHLEPVTHAENIRRGRGAKLTASDAVLIRGSSLGASALARLLGVNAKTVRDIRRGETWR